MNFFFGIKSDNLDSKLTTLDPNFSAVIVDLNGTGDDVNIRRYHNAGSDKSTYGNDGSTFFGAFRLLGV